MRQADAPSLESRSEPQLSTYKQRFGGHDRRERIASTFAPSKTGNCKRKRPAIWRVARSRAGLKRSGVQTQCLRLAACLNPFQGQAVGNHRGGLVTGTGAGEDFPQRVADAAYMAVDLRGAATAALVVDIDDAARIDGVIGCPELV